MFGADEPRIGGGNANAADWPLNLLDCAEEDAEFVIAAKGDALASFSLIMLNPTVAFVGFCTIVCGENVEVEVVTRLELERGGLEEDL